MEETGLAKAVEWSACVFELTGVAVIALAFLYAMLRAVGHVGQRRPDAFERLKTYIGRTLQLALEFLVAADIIRTVTVKPTLEGIVALGLLILVRTVLSWSITVEIEGCWPWLVSELRRGKAGAGGSQLKHGQRREYGRNLTQDS